MDNTDKKTEHEPVPKKTRTSKRRMFKNTP